MLNDQKVGINNMNVGIKIYVKFHIMDIVVITMIFIVISYHRHDMTQYDVVYTILIDFMIIT